MPCDPELFHTLTALHRNNQFAMEARKRADLALGSLLRTQLGWSLKNPAEQNTAIRERAAEMIATGEKFMAWEERDASRFARHMAAGKSADDYVPLKRPEGLDAPDYIEWQHVIAASMRGRLPMSNLEDVTIKRMEELAAQLPAAAWWRENVFKGSLVSLARIVGETGDLSGYATISKVWKRMGLAVMDGTRQGGLTKGAAKQDWIAHGYSPKRRAIMFVIGDSLVKSSDRYRPVYLAEKERQRAKAEAEGLTVAPAAKIPKGRTDEFRSDGHIHKRAQRYMEKQLLADLWCAWNGRATKGAQPEDTLPSQPIAEAA